MCNDIESIQNHLLASLPPEQWQRWKPDLEKVELTLGQVIYESGRLMVTVHQRGIDYSWQRLNTSG